jgi:hypothetical protein
MIFVHYWWVRKECKTLYPPAQPEERNPREESHWAAPISRLTVSDVPAGVFNLLQC